MRRESRGEERLVSCCGDGDVGEGGGGGFRERKGEGCGKDSVFSEFANVVGSDVSHVTRLLAYDQDQV